jgi:two-component system response regulator YesN
MMILLVDDEPFAVDDLAMTIDWDALGIEAVFKAYSGAEALDILGRRPIDIVVTDITMPGMSGLELAAAIRKRWKQTKVILLSGYAEFDYARQALEIGVSEYLTKPISDEEFVRKLKQVMQTIRREWQQIASYERAMSLFEEHLPLLRNNLLRDLIQGKKITRERLTAQLAKFQLPFEEGCRIALLVMRLEGSRSFSADDMFLFEYAIDNIARELYGGDFALWNCNDELGHLVYAVKPTAEASDGAESESYARITLLAEELQRSVEHYLRGRISIVISRTGLFPDDLPALYQSSLGLLRRYIGSEHGFFMTMDRDDGPGAVASLTRLYEPPSFMQLFESGRWENVMEKLDAVFGELAHKRIDTAEHLREIHIQLLSACLYIAHKNGKMLADLAGVELTDRQPPLDAAQLKDWAVQLVTRIRNRLEAEMSDTRRQLVRQVHEYIDSHLDSATLQSIAHHVSLHPVYLSKVYKQETGQSISDTIYRRRMEQATHLLRNTKLKIYEITTMLGYSNAHYFIKLFKEYSGLTPQEYRDRTEGMNGE